ncbi:MAG: glycerol-3-phosphate acyltransferase [Oscillibacter sp.]|jgi:glycerol-3-phosphate acyltransferase PlsY|nr:glycerol-3-phosphate acyltransferase [Oscillibacter sp.]
MSSFLFTAPAAPGIGILILTAAIAYFLGCFNGAVIVSKYILRDDIRNHGSGNAGLTNFYRTFGGGLTFVVILTDVAKAVIAVLVGSYLCYGLRFGGEPAMAMWNVFGKYWAGLFCILGHSFPCMFHFKGGKGILSGGVLAIMIDWRVAVVVWGGFLILTALTRYVSLGSLWAGVTFPIASGLVFHDVVILILAVIIGGLIVWGHRANIKRLVSGTENKFSFHHKTEGKQ